MCIQMSKYGTNHLKVAKSYRLYGVFSEYRFLSVPYMHGTIENMAEFN